MERSARVRKTTGGAAQVSAEQVKELAHQIDETSKYSSGAAKASANFLISLKNIKGKEFEAAMKTLPDLATAMDTDLPAASRLLGKALAGIEKDNYFFASWGYRTVEEARKGALDGCTKNKPTENCAVVMENNDLVTTDNESTAGR